MSTIIHSTTIVTADRDRSVYHDAAIVIEGDRIAAIGPSDEALARFPQAELINGRGKAIMPGFANCHTHFTLTISRGVAENSSFSEHPDHDRAFGALWGPELADEELIVMAQLGVLEALRCGTTTAMEISPGIEVYARETVESGLRLILAEQASDRTHGRLGDTGPFEVDPPLANTASGASPTSTRSGVARRTADRRGCRVGSGHGLSRPVDRAPGATGEARFRLCHSPQTRVGGRWRP